MNVNTVTAVVVKIGILAVSLLATAGTAQGRVTGPRLTSIAVGCGIIQDRWDGLAREYNSPSTSAERREQILNDAANTMSDWRALGCDGVFGSIMFRPMQTICGEFGSDSTACTPLGDLFTDDDQDQVLNAWEVDVGLDTLDPDTNRDGILDGFDATVVGDLILTLGESDLPPGPRELSFEDYRAGLAFQADLAADDWAKGNADGAIAGLNVLVGDLGGCVDDPKAEAPPLPACEALDIVLGNQTASVAPPPEK